VVSLVGLAGIAQTAECAVHGMREAMALPVPNLTKKTRKQNLC